MLVIIPFTFSRLAELADYGRLFGGLKVRIHKQRARG